MKLWAVKIEDEIVIGTHDDGDAVDALLAASKITAEMDGWTLKARPLTELPPGWSKNDVPWGEEAASDRTIGVVMAENAEALAFAEGEG